MSAAKSFGNDLRRVIIVSHLLNQSVDWINCNDETPGFIASAGQDINRAIKRYYQALKKASPSSWAQIESELEEDRIQDLLLLLDEMFNVLNVQEVINMINQNKSVPIMAA